MEVLRVHVKKDIVFFNYKLKNKSNYLIKIKDFTLLIKPETHLIIGDVVRFEPERTNEFIVTINKLAKKLGCKKTIISLSENHWLFGILEGKIERTESLPIGYFQINNEIQYEKISYIGADYDTF